MKSDVGVAPCTGRAGNWRLSRIHHQRVSAVNDNQVPEMDDEPDTVDVQGGADESKIHLLQVCDNDRRCDRKPRQYQ